MGKSKNANNKNSAGIGAKARKGQARKSNKGRMGPSAAEARLHQDVERAGKLAEQIAKGTATAGAANELRGLLEAELRGGRGAEGLKRLWAALETLVSASEAKRLKSAGDLGAPTASALLSLLEGLGSDRFSGSTDPLELLRRLRGLVLKNRVFGGRGEEGRTIWNNSPHKRVFLGNVPEVEDLNAAGSAFEGALLVVVEPGASFNLPQGAVAWTTHLVPCEEGKGSKELRALFAPKALVHSVLRVEGQEDEAVSEVKEVGLRSLCSLILERALVPVPSGDGSEAKLRPLQGLALVGRVFAAAAGLGEVVKASIRATELLEGWEEREKSRSYAFCLETAEACGLKGREWSLEPQRVRAAEILAEAAFSAEFAEGPAAACWQYDAETYSHQEDVILDILREGGELDAACTAAFERGVRSREEKDARAKRHAEFQAQREELKGLWKSVQLRWAKAQPEGSAARALAAQLQGHIENGRVSASAETLALIDELRAEAAGAEKREAKAAAKAKRSAEQQAERDWKILYARLAQAGKSPAFRAKRREIVALMKSRQPLVERCEAARAVLGDSE